MGKRQVVWKVTTPPDGIAEVLQDESHTGQGLSTPSTPTANNISDSVKTEKEEVNKKVGVKSDEGIVDAESQSGREIQAATASKSADATPVDWQSYPYNSGDRSTLENRANKVKERILGCGTKNELIGLYSQGKVSEPEVNWI